MTNSELAGNLAFDILRNRFHMPLVDGKANRDKIEEEITIALYSGELKPLTQEIVDLAISTVDDMIEQYGVEG